MSKLIGSKPHQVPSNADLGTIAYQDANSLNVGTILSTDRIAIDTSGRDTLNSPYLFTVADEAHGVAIDYLTDRTLPTKPGGLFSTPGGGPFPFNQYGNIVLTTRTDYGGYYDIVMVTADTNNTPEVRLVVKSSGNVGIGTDAPAAILDVRDAGATDNAWNDIAIFRPYLNDNAAETSIYLESIPSTTSVPTRKTGIQSKGQNGVARPLVLQRAGGVIEVGNRPAMEESTFGYSATWKTLILGSTGTDYQVDATTISMGYDPSNNPSGSYTGNGLEILFRNNARFLQASATDNGYLQTISMNDGNVGINATDPKRKLHVAGDFAVNGADTEYYGVHITGGEGADPRILIGDWHNASGMIQWNSTERALKIDTQYSTNPATFKITGNDYAETFLEIDTEGHITVPNRGISSRYITSEAKLYLAQYSNWVRCYYREFQTPNAFGYNAVEITITAAGRTDGRGEYARFVINHKQQQANDQYEIIPIETKGIQLAHKFDATGGSNGQGIVEVWVKASAIYNTIAVHGKVTGETNLSTASSTGHIIAENTGSGTQPSGSSLVRWQKDIGHLTYLGNGANATLKYEGNGNRILYTGTAGVGSSSHTQNYNTGLFKMSYDNYGFKPAVIHSNGLWYTNIGTESGNYEKWIKYAIQMNGNDRLRVAGTFSNFADGSNRSIGIEYSLDDGATWTTLTSATMGSSSGQTIAGTITADSLGYYDEAGLATILVKFRINGTGSTTLVGLNGIEFAGYGGNGIDITIIPNYTQRDVATQDRGVVRFGNMSDFTSGGWDGITRVGYHYIYTKYYSQAPTVALDYYIYPSGGPNAYWGCTVEEFTWTNTNGGRFNNFMSARYNGHTLYGAYVDVLHDLQYNATHQGQLSITGIYNGTNGNYLKCSKTTTGTGSPGFGNLVIRSPHDLRLETSAPF